jgi:predicted RNA-binding Zn-ribbon protein involved in translation (DUF1610 family)
MLRYLRYCPSCNASLDPKTIPILNAYSFSCPICGAPLRVAAEHLGVVYVISLILSVALTSYLGFRGLVFALISILGSGFVLLALSVIIGLIWPAKLELRPSKDSTLRLRNGPRQ